MTASETALAKARREFHVGLLNSGILSLNAAGIPSNADSSQPSSIAYATSIARALQVEAVQERMAGQSSGGGFEQACADFLIDTFPRFLRLRPGTWEIRKVGGRKGAVHASVFEQYSHLADLDEAVRANPQLRAVLGNAYAIAPDVVVSRAPEPDSYINADDYLVDDTVARRAAIRSVNQPQQILHAVISCKWTLRSDRAQNARSEALNLIRNRKGRLPHIAVVTGEPTPSRLSSLALGTGDIDAVYHFALPELIAAVDEVGSPDAIELLGMMVEGKRLKDIADLPLDLTV